MMNRRVAVNGCYDVLHIGHVRLLNYASEFGELVVGINSDKSIKKLKGENRPINNQFLRQEFLYSLVAPDEVIIFDEINAVNFLKKVRPDFYVCGGNYTLETMNQEEREYLESIGCQIKFFPLVPGHSSTNIINKINEHTI